MAVTLKDVARLAKVDVTSVSNTLRNSPRAAELREETRRRILDAAQKLGYRRNAFAASMRTGQNSTVAVISSEENLAVNPNAHTVLSGILRAAASMNFGIKLYQDNHLSKQVDEILSNQIKHVICMSVEQAPRLELALLCRMHQLNLVYIAEHAHEEFPAVNVDNFQGGKDVAEYLVRRGHRKIALLCAPHRYHYMTDRHNGFLAGLKEHGIAPDFSRISCLDRERCEVIHGMLSLPPELRPTAFFAIGDLIAQEILHCAIRMGLRVPEDVSIVGFGNSSTSETAFIPLTTTAGVSDEVGNAALKIVLGKDCGILPDAGNNYLIRSAVLERDSVCSMIQ